MKRTRECRGNSKVHLERSPYVGYAVNSYFSKVKKRQLKVKLSQDLKWIFLQRRYTNSWKLPEKNTLHQCPSGKLAGRGALPSLTPQERGGAKALQNTRESEPAHWGTQGAGACALWEGLENDEVTSGALWRSLKRQYQVSMTWRFLLCYLPKRIATTSTQRLTQHCV